MTAISSGVAPSCRGRLAEAPAVSSLRIQQPELTAKELNSSLAELRASNAKQFNQSGCDLVGFMMLFVS